MPQRVYLSGGMEYATDEGRDWRRDMQEWLENTLGCSVFNPNIESDAFFRSRFPDINFRQLKSRDISAYTHIVEQLVEIDCREIAERTDFLICYWDESAHRGAGTKGELTMAHHFGKPVYMVTGVDAKNIPGWILGCTTRMFADFPALQHFLQENAIRESSEDTRPARGTTNGQP